MLLSLSFFLAVVFVFSSLSPHRHAGDQAGMHHQHQHQHQDHHTMDADGMVMNENTDRLPKDCDKLASEEQITVRAGKNTRSSSTERCSATTSESGRCRRAQR